MCGDLRVRPAASVTDCWSVELRGDLLHEQFGPGGVRKVDELTDDLFESCFAVAFEVFSHLLRRAHEVELVVVQVFGAEPWHSVEQFLDL